MIITVDIPVLIFIACMLGASMICEIALAILRIYEKRLERKGRQLRGEEWTQE